MIILQIKSFHYCGIFAVRPYPPVTRETGVRFPDREAGPFEREWNALGHGMPCVLLSARLIKSLAIALTNGHYASQTGLSLLLNIIILQQGVTSLHGVVPIVQCNSQWVKCSIAVSMQDWYKCNPRGATSAFPGKTGITTAFQTMPLIYTIQSAHAIIDAQWVFLA